MSEAQASPERAGHPFAVVGTVVMLALLVGAVVSVIRVVSPTMVDVEHADAVMVHAGGEERLDAGLELVEAGVAPVLVLSDVGSDYGRADGFLDDVCGREEPVEVLCPVPEPPSTIGEARALGRLAEARGWDRVAVVTSRGHLARARLADNQCTDAEVLPVAADPDATPSVRTVRDEWVRAVGTATVMRACW